MSRTTHPTFRAVPPRRGTRAFSLIEMLITLALILIVFVMLYSRGSRSFQEKQLAACQKNLQAIHLILTLYAGDFDGRFPALTNATGSEQPLSLLLPRYSTVTEPFICPGTKASPLPEGESFAKRRISYSYYMGRTLQDSGPLLSDGQVDEEPKIPGYPLFASSKKQPGANHAQYGGNILFCDGGIARFPAANTNDLSHLPPIRLLNPKP